VGARAEALARAVLPTAVSSWAPPVGQRLPQPPALARPGSTAPNSTTSSPTTLAQLSLSLFLPLSSSLSLAAVTYPFPGGHAFYPALCAQLDARGAAADPGQPAWASARSLAAGGAVCSQRAAWRPAALRAASGRPAPAWPTLGQCGQPARAASAPVARSAVAESPPPFVGVAQPFHAVRSAFALPSDAVSLRCSAQLTPRPPPPSLLGPIARCSPTTRARALLSAAGAPVQLPLPSLSPPTSLPPSPRCATPFFLSLMLATAPAPTSGVPPCRARPAVDGCRECTVDARSPAKLAPAWRPSQPARRPLRGGLRLASARQPASVACSRLAWPSPARRFPTRCGSLQRGRVGLAVGPHQATDILGGVSPRRFQVVCFRGG
jgi:hypothetical protein